MKAYRKTIALVLAVVLIAVFVIGAIHSLAEEGMVGNPILASEVETNGSELVEEAITLAVEDPVPEGSEDAMVEEPSYVEELPSQDEPADPDAPDAAIAEPDVAGIYEEETLSTDRQADSEDAEIVSSEELAESEISAVSDPSVEANAESEEMNTESKDSESDEELSLFSMLPLEERTVYLTIPADMDITAIPVSWLIRNLQFADGSYVTDIPSNADIVWNFLSENSRNMILDNYQKVSRRDTIDLSAIQEYSINQKIDMLVGSGEQLDGSMVRYFINIDLSAQEDQLEFELWQEDANGVRTKVGSVKPVDGRVFSTVYGYGTAVTAESPILYFDNFEIDYINCKYYLGIKSALVQNPNYDLKVYVSKESVSQNKDGSYSSNLISGGNNLFEGVAVNCDMSIPGTGIPFILYDYKTDEPLLPEQYNSRWTSSIYGNFTRNCIYFHLSLKYDDSETGNVMRSASFSLYAEPSIYISVDEILGEKQVQTSQHDNFEDFPYVYQYIDGVKTKVAEAIKGRYSISSEKIDNKTWYEWERIYTLQLNSYYDSTKKVLFNVPNISTYQALYEEYYTTISEVESFGTSIENPKDYEFELIYDSENHLFLNNEYTIVSTYSSGRGAIDAVRINLIGQIPEGEYFYSDAFDSPIIGTQDPYLQITGVNLDGETLDAYVIENGKAINMDTYYGYGYQTILVNDYLTDDEMARLQPVFSTGDYSGTRLRTEMGTEDLVSGVSTVDFSDVDEPVHLIASITDKDGNERAKNYYVRVVSKHTGPKLYVYDGWQQLNEDGTYANLREVMLDEYFEEKHDILFANVGDEPLTGIKVTFTGTGAKLDEYWTVNSYPSGTLNPFTQTTDKSAYGYIDNIGKIRLIPDGSDDVIEGYVTISANGQEDVVIHVSGLARQPRIMTSKLGDTVKYVPYSFFISTNNMYDWNTQTFSVTEGTLPPGMSLNGNTGEIYGAPLSAGTYTFTVRADFAYERFEASEKEYTIVVEDNEDATVFFTSDDGYAIVPAEGGDIGYVGEEESAYHFVYTPTGEDEIYISEGLFYRFVKLWLNGQELVRDVDYTAIDGSTRITIATQTMETYVVDGRNTISAEFNIEGADSERGINLKRTSQNFYYYSTAFHVIFNTNGHGATPQTQEVRYGEKASNPGSLSADGYQFDGWYADAALSSRYDFAAPVKDNITVYAKWNKVEEPTTEEEPTSAQEEPVTKEEETTAPEETTEQGSEEETTTEEEPGEVTTPPETTRVTEEPTAPSTSDNEASRPGNTTGNASGTTGTNPQANTAGNAGAAASAEPDYTTLHGIASAFASGSISFFEMVDYTYALKHGTAPAVGETVRYFDMGAAN